MTNAHPFTTIFQMRCELGEGIIWDPEHQELIWFDINRHVMCIGKPEHNTVELVGFGEPVAAGFFAPENNLLIASASGLLQFDRTTAAITRYREIEANNPLTRSNDSRTAPGNAIWFGTMGRKLETGLGCVYHVREGVVTPLFEKTSIPNATCFSQDGTTAYFADTPKQAITKIQLDPDTGLPIGEAELFVDLSGENLFPDGAVLDSAGRLWNAQWGAGRVACYDEKGVFVKAINLPASKLTCPCFGGKDLKTLYVTSAFDGMDQEERQAEPEAGAVFAIEMDIAGCPERRLSTI